MIAPILVAGLCDALEVGDASILHVDLDAFYASVEERRDPTLRGLPFVVGGGVVLSPSYAARRFGVRSGMGIRRARELCPRLVVVSGEFSEYAPASEAVFEICRRFTPLVEEVSIDEAYLDVSGATHLFGSSDIIARDLKALVLEETQLVVSIGVARTKALAKVASQVAKPDGIVFVDPDRETEFLNPLPVGLVWGIGPATVEKLARYGVETVGELAALPNATIAGWLGPGLGPQLRALARNVDARRVNTTHRARSVSSQAAFGGDNRDTAYWERVLLSLADRVSARLRDKERAAGTITTRVRFADLTAVTRSATLNSRLATTDGLFLVARRLMYTAVEEAADGRGLSLLAIGASRLGPAVPQQLEFTLGLEHDLVRAGTAASIQRFDLDRAIDGLRDRFGRDAVGRASVKLMGDGGMVPEEFRKLAQKKETG